MYTQADENPALPSTEVDKRNELYNALVYTQADEDLALASTEINESREVYTPQVFRADKKEVRDSNISRPMNPFSNKYKTAEGDLSSRATESNPLADAVAKRDEGFVYKSSVVHNVDGAK